MFESKVKALFETTKKKPETSTNTATATTGKLNPFIQAGMKEGAKTLSGNGSNKFSTTGNSFVDQFAKVGSYKKPRKFEEISQDCETLWAENKLLSVMFMIYLRIITRIVTFFDNSKTETSQKGAELKHESIMRYIWLSTKSPETFKKNLEWFVTAGSWQDIFVMLQTDLIYNGWDKRILDWRFLGNFILTGLNNENTSNLVKKYLPQIKAKSHCTTVESQADTMIGKWICHLLFWNGEKTPETQLSKHYKQYRLLKTSGTAHEWQKIISQRKFYLLDFNKIPGRALSKHIVRTKFLFNQHLSEAYSAWAKKPEMKSIKYTGFVHELFEELGNTVKAGKYNTLAAIPIHEQDTINKQFQSLIDKGRGNDPTKVVNYMVVRDTSNSMTSIATGTKSSAYSVGKALALYFSEFLAGPFKGTWIEFNTTCQMHRWLGNTPLEKWFNDRTCTVANTNILSVFEMFARIKLDSKVAIPESEFPTGILCISDGEFDGFKYGDKRTNHEQMLEILRRAGFSKEYVDKFQLVMWNLTSNFYGKGTGEKFETYGNIANVYYFGGYSPSIISFLNGKVETAEDLLLNALDQEILNLVEL